MLKIVSHIFTNLMMVNHQMSIENEKQFKIVFEKFFVTEWRLKMLSLGHNNEKQLNYEWKSHKSTQL